MCGRYVVTNAVHKTKEIVKSAIAINVTDNFNASPQQKLPVIKSYTNGKTIDFEDDFELSLKEIKKLLEF